MPFVTCDTTLPDNAIETINDEKLHHLIDSELHRLPVLYAVYVLYDGNGAIKVGTGTLRNVVPLASSQYPDATRFSIHGLSLTRLQDLEQLAEMLKQEFGLDQSSKKEPIEFRKQK